MKSIFDTDIWEGGSLDGIHCEGVEYVSYITEFMFELGNILITYLLYVYSNSLRCCLEKFIHNGSIYLWFDLELYECVFSNTFIRILLPVRFSILKYVWLIRISIAES